MVGQGLGRSIEAALEWRKDYARGEKRLLDDLARLRSFLEGAAGDQGVVDIQQSAHAVAAKRCGDYLNPKLVHILGELVQPSGRTA